MNCFLVVAYALIWRTAGAPYLAGAAIWISALLHLYFRANRLRRLKLASALQWTHSISTCLFLILLSPQFIGVCILVILDGLLDEMLHPLVTKRSLQLAILGTIALSASVVNIASLTHFDIYLFPQVLSTFEISLVHIVLVIPYTLDFLQRLWLFQIRISDTVATLQQTNHSLETAQVQLQQRLHELNQLLEISRAVGSKMDLPSLLLHMLTQLHSMIPYGRATVNMTRQDELVEIAATGDLPDFPSSIAGANRQDEHVKFLMSLTEPAITADTSRFVPGLQGSLIMVPFIARGECIGVLTLRHAQTGFYTQQDGDLCMAFANQVAGMIDATRLKESAANAMVVAERHRLARELHDSVSQSLFGIVLGTRTAMEQLERAPAAARTALDYSIRLAGTALAEMRALIFTLRPETLERKGLVSALQSQINLLQPHHDMRITLSVPHGEPDLSRDQKEALYRIAAEAMQNAIRHSHCRVLDLRIETTPELMLEICDDGCGFDPGTDFSERIGECIGLKSMHERAADLGGVLVIDSAPGKGTRISITVHQPAVELRS